MRHPVKSSAGLAIALFVAVSCNGLVGNDPPYLVGGASGTVNEAGAGADEGAGQSGGGLTSGGSSSRGGARSGGGSPSGGGRATGGASTTGGAGGDAGAAGAGGSSPCPGECMPGTVDRPMQKCGVCSKGTQTRQRTCGSDCRWGAYSAWSTCALGTVECMPGAVDSDSQQCGACNKGSQSRSRTCGDQCTWGAWGAWGACAEKAQCKPDHYDCCGTNKWKWCLPDTCTWSDQCESCSSPNCDCP
ncbi:MAG TPA: hypothetical protein VFQ35_05030 [Polyangiaceae bacterium]|nr:hypothetical protein [Polyangiaceae bacterium]